MRLRAALLLTVLATVPAIAQGTPPASTKKPPVTKAPAAKPPTAAKATATQTKPAAPRARTTLSGIYTLEEAKAGKEMYASLCASCHTAASHTGPSFRTKWAGKPLSELFMFMKTNMPKNDPASLADEDYGVLLAYMLQMNHMPTGKAYLSTDPAVLAKIKIDTVRAVPVKKP